MLVRYRELQFENGWHLGRPFCLMTLPKKHAWLRHRVGRPLTPTLHGWIYTVAGHIPRAKQRPGGHAQVCDCQTRGNGDRHGTNTYAQCYDQDDQEPSGGNQTPLMIRSEAEQLIGYQLIKALSNLKENVIVPLSFSNLCTSFETETVTVITSDNQ
jgi:hypothetical protein